MKHGRAKDWGKKPIDPTYSSWGAMRRRCLDQKHPQFKHYGGKGIKVCERWESFENFLADMGDRTPGLTLDRIEKEKNYEPGNCRWATPKQQAREKQQLLTHRGITRSLTDWAATLNMTPGALHQRIHKHGWTLVRALSTPRRF